MYQTQTFGTALKRGLGRAAQEAEDADCFEAFYGDDDDTDWDWDEDEE